MVLGLSKTQAAILSTYYLDIGVDTLSPQSAPSVDRTTKLNAAQTPAGTHVQLVIYMVI